MRGEGDVNKDEARKCYMKEFNLRINTYQPAECAGMERNIVKFTTVGVQHEFSARSGCTVQIHTVSIAINISGRWKHLPGLIP